MSKVARKKKRKSNRKWKKKKKDSALEKRAAEEMVDDSVKKTYLSNEAKVGRRNADRNEPANQERSEERKGVHNIFEVLKNEKKNILINSKTNKKETVLTF